MSAVAQRWLAAEAAKTSDGFSLPSAAERVFEQLRICVTRFAGADGFSALMRRALVLSSAKAPALQSLILQPDGSIGGLTGSSATTKAVSAEDMTALIAHLLNLLITFIGEPLTLRLIQEAWPEVPSDK